MQEHNFDQRYMTTLASIKLVEDSGLLDLIEEDFAFLTTTKPWINVDRSRARRCMEAATYGSIDVLGLPRIVVPAEFISGVIALFVSPVNTLSACAIMDGVEWSDNSLNGIEAPVSANELCIHTLRIRAGICDEIEQRLKHVRSQIKEGII